MGATSNPPVPNLVRDALERHGAYDFGLGVVLRAPTNPSGSGGSASYRLEYRIEPMLPGRPLPARREKYARNLGKAYAKAQAKFDEMKQRAAGIYVEYATDTCFGVVERWYASPHPRWGENYPRKVRSLLYCWVTAKDVTIMRPWSVEPESIAEAAIGSLSADDYDRALEHVRHARSYRTYTEVHGLVVQILKWAVANRYLRPTDLTVLHHVPLAVPVGEEETGRGAARKVPDQEIPPPAMIDALASTADRLLGTRTRTMIYLLAYSGLRISECLALRNDDRFVFDGHDRCWRIHVRQQVHKSKRKTLPPKWRKKRWVFVPEWLTDEVESLLRSTPRGAPVFPSPGKADSPNGRDREPHIRRTVSL